MTLTEYFALAHDNQVALAAALGSHQPTVRQWAIGERPIPVVHGAAIERATGGAVTRQELFPDTWSAIWPELAFKVELRAAVASARHVFEGERLAEDVLHYLEQVLAAGAPVPAQTGITPGSENASIAKETHTPLGVAPTVVGADPFRAAARHAGMHQARANLAQAADAPARPTAAQHADIHRQQAAIDQAAAAMTAESAQKLVAAERSVAARAGDRVALDPLEALSREVFSLSYELRQPAHFAVQLLILCEMRQQRYSVSRSR